MLSIKKCPAWLYIESQGLYIPLQGLEIGEKSRGLLKSTRSVTCIENIIKESENSEIF